LRAPRGRQSLCPKPQPQQIISACFNLNPFSLEGDKLLLGVACNRLRNFEFYDISRHLNFGETLFSPKKTNFFILQRLDF